MKKKTLSDLEEMEVAEELAAYESTKKGRRNRYRCCPRCGGDQWKALTTNSKGKAIACDECKEIADQ